MGSAEPGGAEAGRGGVDGRATLAGRVARLGPLLGLVALFIYSKVRFDHLEAIAGGPTPGPAGEPPSQSYLPPQLRTTQGKPGVTFHTYYVPVDSRVYHAGGHALPLEATLVLRNPSTSDEIYVRQVDYFAADGRKIRSFTQKPFALGPMEMLEFQAAPRSAGDREGSHFLVTWGAKHPRVRPLVEAIMVDERAHVVLLREATLVRTGPPPARTRAAPAARERREPPSADYELKKDPPTKELRPKNP